MRIMNTAMAGIKGSAADIGKIIKTIDEIAFQTNILALNAAVDDDRSVTLARGQGGTGRRSGAQTICQSSCQRLCTRSAESGDSQCSERDPLGR